MAFILKYSREMGINIYTVRWMTLSHTYVHLFTSTTRLLTGSGDMEAKSKFAGDWEDGDGGRGRGESLNLAQF